MRAVIGSRLFAIAVGLAALGGCQFEVTPGAEPKRSEQAVELNSTGRAKLTGRVIYERRNAPEVEQVRTRGLPADAPGHVPGQGWYVNKENKGIQHALVLLRVPKGAAFPRPAGPVHTRKRAVVLKDWQFQPRLLLLKPSEDLEFVNRGPITVDFSLGNDENASRQTVKSDSSHLFAIKASNREPIRIWDGIRPWMSGWVWKPTHPYAAVTGEDGSYTIEDVPIIEGDVPPSLWIWHEMLPGDHFQEVGKPKLENGKTAVKDITIKD
jgi:hypothetical protein